MQRCIGTCGLVSYDTGGTVRRKIGCMKLGPAKYDFRGASIKRSSCVGVEWSWMIKVCEHKSLFASSLRILLTCKPLFLLALLWPMSKPEWRDNDTDREGLKKRAVASMDGKRPTKAARRGFCPRRVARSVSLPCAAELLRTKKLR